MWRDNHAFTCNAQRLREELLVKDTELREERQCKDAEISRLQEELRKVRVDHQQQEPEQVKMSW